MNEANLKAKLERTVTIKSTMEGLIDSESLEDLPAPAGTYRRRL